MASQPAYGAKPASPAATVRIIALTGLHIPKGGIGLFNLIIFVLVCLR